MARVPAARPFASGGSRLGGGPPSGPGRAGGDIGGTWMVTVNGHGRSEYLLEYRTSGEVTGKGRPAAGGAWLSDLKGFHEQGGKFTWTSYVNNREAGRFEANIVDELKGFHGSGTLITGKRLDFTGTRTTPVPPGAAAAPVGGPPVVVAHPKALAREDYRAAAVRAAAEQPTAASLGGISMQACEAASEPSASEVRAEQDAEFQLGLIRDQAKDLELQLSREREGLEKLTQEVDVVNQKVQNVEGQRARYGENPKNTAELEKAQAELAEARRPLDTRQAKVSALQAELEEKHDLLAAVTAALA